MIELHPNARRERRKRRERRQGLKEPHVHDAFWTDVEIILSRMEKVSVMKMRETTPPRACFQATRLTGRLVRNDTVIQHQSLYNPKK